MAYEDFVFDFSGEGFLQADKLELSRYSPRRIYSESFEIIPARLQPAFVRQRGPTVNEHGAPLITGWIKTIVFDAWRVTRLGAEVFQLRGGKSDVEHFTAIESCLAEAGLKFSVLGRSGAPSPYTEL